MSVFLDRDATDFLQQVAQAVATVLQFEVAIVDRGLRRVAGTGRYRLLVGENVHDSSSFANVVRTGRPCVVLNPREDPACRECGTRDRCVESCHISYPLRQDGEPLGVLALVGFTSEQHARMVAHQDEYLNFIEQMARLVEMAVRNISVSRALHEARDQLRGVVEAVGEGIIAIDAAGTIICCNQAAARLLQLEAGTAVGRRLADIYPDAPLLQLLQSGSGHANQEVTLTAPGGPLRHISSAAPLRSEGRISGAVALLKSVEDVHRIAYELSVSQPSRAIDHILGQAPALQESKLMALRAAAGYASVLLRGESGTGKELFARAIHHHSPRRSGPFVPVNCAAMPEELLESELFGYEEGAFTGARRGGKPGKFELAHRGTLFLDEVADCSLRLQAKLLRVLDRGEVQRVGGVRSTEVDVRIVAATNRELESMVASNQFREDLYFRLNVIPIPIPPLRERAADIMLLFERFLHRHAAGMSRVVPAVAPETAARLQAYPWPGNVRELENVAQYVLYTCGGEVIYPEHLPPRWHQVEPRVEPVPLVRAEEWERKAIAEGLRRLGTGSRAKEALARQLGMSRSTIYRKIKAYGLG